MPGLVPGIHAVRRRRPRKALQSLPFFPSSLRFVPHGVDGRDKPGHDGRRDCRPKKRKPSAHGSLTSPTELPENFRRSLIGSSVAPSPTVPKSRSVANSELIAPSARILGRQESSLALAAFPSALSAPWRHGSDEDGRFLSGGGYATRPSSLRLVEDRSDRGPCRNISAGGGR
jgi:hypothetical protein